MKTQTKYDEIIKEALKALKTEDPNFVYVTLSNKYRDFVVENLKEEEQLGATSKELVEFAEELILNICIRDSDDHEKIIHGDPFSYFQPPEECINDKESDFGIWKY